MKDICAYHAFSPVLSLTWSKIRSAKKTLTQKLVDSVELPWHGSTGNRALAIIGSIANPSESGSLIKGMNALILQARRGGANVLEITGGSDNTKLLRFLNGDLFKNKYNATVQFNGP